MNEVAICIMRGGFISSVTKVDPQLAEHVIRQYRSSGLTVRVFSDPEKFAAFSEANYAEYKANERLTRQVEEHAKSKAV